MAYGLVRGRTAIKTCSNPECKVPKPEFHVDKTHVDGLASACKECKKEANVKYLSKPGIREQQINYNKKKRLNNKRVIKKAKAVLEYLHTNHWKIYYEVTKMIKERGI